MVVVKDALIESAKGVLQCSNLLLEPHNSTGALTDAMISATKEQERVSSRRAKLKRIREMLTRPGVPPKELLTSEVIELAIDLGLESMIFKDTACIGAYDPKSFESSLLATPQKIRQSILEKTTQLEMSLDVGSRDGITSPNATDCEIQSPIT